MLVLTLDAALDGCGAGLVRDGVVLAERVLPGGRGSAAALAGLAEAVLGDAAIDAVAVTVGPGSFTGVRAALALAQGIGLGRGVPVWGVSVGGAMRAELAGGAAPAGATVWVVVDSKRGRVFLDDGVSISAVGLDALPVPEGVIVVAGDAAEAVGTALAGQGVPVVLPGLAGVGARGIALAAGRPLPAVPLYVEGPAARPGPGARPAPV